MPDRQRRAVCSADARFSIAAGPVERLASVSVLRRVVVREDLAGRWAAVPCIRPEARLRAALREARVQEWAGVRDLERVQASASVQVVVRAERRDWCRLRVKRHVRSVRVVRRGVDASITRRAKKGR